MNNSSYTVIESKTQCLMLPTKYRTVQVVESGQLLAVGVFNTKRTGSECGEIHLFMRKSAGSLVPMKAFRALAQHGRRSLYWAFVGFEDREFAGVRKPVLVIEQEAHRQVHSGRAIAPLIISI